MTPCTHHTGVASAANCAECASPLCADCVVVLDVRPLCGACKARVVRAVERGDALDEGDRRPSPWEERPSPATLLRTAKLVLFSPRAFYSGLRRRGSGHLSYFLILNWPLAVLGGAIYERVPWRTESTTTGLMLIVGYPLIGVAMVVFWALVTHTVLRIVGGNGARLAGTMRTVMYAQSADLVSWLPLLGTIASTAWYLWAVPVGLKRMHGTTTGRAIAANAVPGALLVWITVDEIATAVRWALA